MEFSLHMYTDISISFFRCKADGRCLDATRKGGPILVPNTSYHPMLLIA